MSSAKSPESCCLRKLNLVSETPELSCNDSYKNRSYCDECKRYERSKGAAENKNANGLRRITLLTTASEKASSTPDYLTF